MSGELSDQVGGAAVAAASSPFALEHTELARILRVVLAVLFVTAVVVLVVGARLGIVPAAVSGGFGVLAVPGVGLVLRRGHAAAAALGTTAVLLGVGLYTTVGGLGIHDAGMLVFPIAIIVAALLLDRRFGIGISALAVLLAIVVGALDALGWRRAGEVTTAPDDVVWTGILLAATAVLAHWLTRNLYRGVERALVVERSYHEIFNATSEAIIVHDPETGAILDANEPAVRMSGMTHDALLGRRFEQFAAADDEHSAARARELVHQAATVGPQVFEWSFVRPDGKRLWMENTLRKASIRGRDVVLAVIRDRTELRTLSDRLREGDKLQAIGRLAGGVAHDFNNQLTAILGATSLLEAELEGSPALLQHVRIVRQCARRSAELTRNLLAFAQKGVPQQTVVDCGALVEEVIGLLRRSIDRRITIERIGPDRPARTMGDASSLHSALLNLALNARDAMPDGGRLTFEVAIAEVEAADAGDPSGAQPLSPGAHVVLRVRDTGIGMDDETRRRLFEPFFTRKPGGHGLGLAAVYGTVRSHHGRVRVASAPGQGTTFEVLLPLAEGVARAEPKASATPVPLAGEWLATKRVLLVDDEPDVASSAAALLRRFGGKIETCHDGEEAIARIERSPNGYDVVLLDHGMPRLSGSDVLMRLRARGCTVPVVLTSGYPADVEPRALELAQGFVAKPYGLGELAMALGRAMDVGGFARDEVSPPRAFA